MQRRSGARPGARARPTGPSPTVKALPAPPACTGRAVRVGADIQAAIDAAGPNGRLCLAAGTHRLKQPLRPKAGQRIGGRGGGPVRGPAAGPLDGRRERPLAPRRGRRRAGRAGRGVRRRRHRLPVPRRRVARTTPALKRVLSLDDASPGHGLPRLRRRPHLGGRRPSRRGHGDLGHPERHPQRQQRARHRPGPAVRAGGGAVRQPGPGGPGGRDGAGLGGRRPRGPREPRRAGSTSGRAASCATPTSTTRASSGWAAPARSGRWSRATASTTTTPPATTRPGRPAAPSGRPAPSG